MPVNLDPRLDALESRLERGALMRVDNGPAAPAARGDSATTSTPLGGQVLQFQYNPETITRTRAGRWDPRLKRQGQQIASPQQVRARAGQGSSGLLAESEQIAFTVVFDATEAVLAGRAGAAEAGVLPQLAFLELVSSGRAGQTADRQRETVQPIRPDELLLVLGTARIFPAVLTNLSITEKKFLPTLVPLRAEVELKLTVLEPIESRYSSWIDAAFARLVQNRVTHSEEASSGSLAEAIARELGGPR